MLHMVLASACMMQVPPRRVDPPMPQPAPSDVPMGMPKPATEPPASSPTSVPASDSTSDAAPAATPDAAAEAVPPRDYAIDGAKPILRARPVAPTEPPAKPDRLRVRVPGDKVDLLAAGAPSGRILVFFVAEGSRIDGDPVEAPFFEDPQPMAGIDVKDLAAGVPVELGEGTAWYPYSMSEFDGTFRVQAVLDRDTTVRGHMGPGNLMGRPTTVTLSRTVEDDLTLDLDALVPQDAMPEGQIGEDPDRPQLVWVNVPSTMVASRGTPAVHRAGVILPPGYHDTAHPRRIWPTIYVIPGFGGRHLGAASLMKVVHSEIEHSVIMEKSRILDIPRLEDSLIGKEAEVSRTQRRPRALRLMVGDHCQIDTE